MFWPRDLLPQKVKNIRILSYGYDSKIGFIHGTNKNGIYQHAENMLSALERVRLDVGLPAGRENTFISADINPSRART